MKPDILPFDVYFIGGRSKGTGNSGVGEETGKGFF